MLKGFESYEQYIRNLQQFDHELKYNIADSKARRFVLSKIEVRDHQGEFVYKRRRNYEQRLDRIKTRLAGMKKQYEDLMEQKTNDTSENERLGGRVEQLASRITKWEERRAEYDVAMRDLELTVRRHREDTNQFVRQIRQLDHKRLEHNDRRARSLKHLGSGQNSAMEADNDKLAATGEGTVTSFASSPFPPLELSTVFLPKPFGPVISKFKLALKVFDPPKEETTEGPIIVLEESQMKEAPR